MNRERILYERFIRDLGFSIVEKMPLSSTTVYKVFDGDDYRIIKMASITEIFEYNLIKKEHEALRRAKGIAGVPELLDYFDPYNSYAAKKGRMIALLREYVEGEVLDIEDRLASTGQKNQLKKTVTDLHNSGIAGIELRYSNIVLSDRPYIIDLNYVKFIEELHQIDFEILSKSDLRQMNELFD